MPTPDQSTLKPETVGVIDVGSNTIKLLIAQRSPTLPAEKVSFHVEETRIGEGMTGTPPRIDSAAIQRGIDAIERLCSLGEQCDTLCIVATSAVRDAANKQEFVNAVEKRCGHELSILSGDEEATLIGHAIKCDPDLAHLSDYSILDLGGGSLECIQFSDHKMLREESLQLGSVRLASLLLKDRERPLAPSDRDKISQHVRAAWERSSLATNHENSVAVLTGGAAKHLAESLAPRQLRDGLDLCSFSEIADHICMLPQSERSIRYPIPESRADIFPTAMVTLEESLRYLGCQTLFFTEFNLRFGVASLLLSHGALPRL